MIDGSILPAMLAETVHAVLTDDALRSRLLQRQRRALATLDRNHLVEELMRNLARAGLTS